MHLRDRAVDHDIFKVWRVGYPHTDYAERAEDLYRLCRARWEKAIDPVSAVYDCRMVGLYPTTLEPMASFVRAIEASETEAGILSISLVHGFPWGDTPDTGTRVLVIADGDRNLAQDVAERLGVQLYHTQASMKRS